MRGHGVLKRNKIPFNGINSDEKIKNPLRLLNYIVF